MNILNKISKYAKYPTSARKYISPSFKRINFVFIKKKVLAIQLSVEYE